MYSRIREKVPAHLLNNFVENIGSRHGVKPEQLRVDAKSYVTPAIVDRIYAEEILTYVTSGERRRQNVEAIEIGVALWLIPAALIYGVGLATAWVARGFTRK
jgi:hypothetical protein